MIQFRRQDLPHEQYVFFYVDVFGHSLNSGQGQPWARGDEDDAVAREAFQVRDRDGVPCCPLAEHRTVKWDFSSSVLVLLFPATRSSALFFET